MLCWLQEDIPQRMTSQETALLQELGNKNNTNSTKQPSYTVLRCTLFAHNTHSSRLKDIFTYIPKELSKCTAHVRQSKHTERGASSADARELNLHIDSFSRQ